MRVITFSNFLIISLFVILSGCSKNPVEDQPITPNKPQASKDSISVLFKLGGEIKISQEPLTRSSSNDLYAINVRQSIHSVINGSNYDATEPTNYAYGYFDNLNDVTIKLAKNMFYHFELVYIPDGKSKIHKYSDGHYGNPCASIYPDAKNGNINEFMYSSTYHINQMEYGAAQANGVTDFMIQSTLFNNIERYQGVLLDYKATDDASEVNINLYRMMVGLKIIADDFKEGEISISSNFGAKYTLKPSTNSTTNTLDIVVEMINMPTIWNLKDRFYNDNIADIINSEQHFSDIQEAPIFITYTDKEGKEITLYSNSKFRYKRLIKHTLQFSVSDAITNGGITPTLKDNPNDELKDGQWTW